MLYKQLQHCGVQAVISCQRKRQATSNVLKSKFLLTFISPNGSREHEVLNFILYYLIDYPRDYIHSYIITVEK